MKGYNPVKDCPVPGVYVSRDELPKINFKFWRFENKVGDETYFENKEYLLRHLKNHRAKKFEKLEMTTTDSIPLDLVDELNKKDRKGWTFVKAYPKELTMGKFLSYANGSPHDTQLLQLEKQIEGLILPQENGFYAISPICNLEGSKIRKIFGNFGIRVDSLKVDYWTGISEVSNNETIRQIFERERKDAEDLTYLEAVIMSVSGIKMEQKTKTDKTEKETNGNPLRFFSIDS